MVATYRVNGDDVLIPSLVPLQNLPRYHVEKTHIVDIQDTEPYLGADFCLVLGRSEDGEVGGGHESGLGLS